VKLYYAPNTCSLASCIVAAEAGIALDLQKVDLRTRRTTSGADYREVNPLGYVPALRLDDGRVLTEGVAILQFLADCAPHAKLAPASGQFERTHLQQWLTFVATELHKSFSPWLFHPAETGAQAQDYAKARIRDRMTFLENHLADNVYLLGGDFTVADAYCFTILGWSKFAGIELAAGSALGRYFRRISARPAVRSALQAHENLKAA